MWSRSLLRSCRGSCRVHQQQTSSGSLLKRCNRDQHTEARTTPIELVGASLHYVSKQDGPQSHGSRVKLPSYAKDASENEISYGSSASATLIGGDSEAQSPTTRPTSARSLAQYDATGCQFRERKPMLGLKFSFSAEAAFRLGCLRRTKHLATLNGDGLAPFDLNTQAKKLILLLDQAIQCSNERGLGCLALAIDSIKTILQPSTALTVLTYLETSRQKFKVSTTVKSDGTTTKVRLVAIKKTNITATIADALVTVPALSVSILAHCSSDRATESPGSSFKFKDDIWYVSENAAMVIARMTQTTTFSSCEDMLKTVTETLLRILEFRTPFLQIQGIKVKALGAFAMQAMAHWASADDSLDSLTRKVDVMCEETAVKRNVTKETFAQDDEQTRDPNNIAEIARASKSGDSLADLISLRQHGERIRFQSPSNPLEPSQSGSGTSNYQFVIDWPVDCRAEVCQLTQSQVRQTASAAVAGISHNVTDLIHAAQSIRGSLPGMATVWLQVAKGREAAELPQGNWPVAAINAKITGPTCLNQEFRLTSHWTEIDTTRCKEAAPGTSAKILVMFSAEITLTPHSVSEPKATTYAEVSSAIGNLIGTIVGLGQVVSLYELASECVGAIMKAHPLSDQYNVSSVKVSLSAADKLGSLSSEPIFNARGSRRGRAIIALGSNVGQRVQNIEAACRLINDDPDLELRRTSPLYETRPMYYEDQETFVNGTCLVGTSLAPTELLDRLQKFENALGRVKLIDKGPRNIDLDIVTYNEDSVHTERLIIPHKLMLEREFVLRPLCDMYTHTRHPMTGKFASQHLDELVTGDLTMFPITPLMPECEPLRSLDPKRRTQVMSILNVTPDSFSDGGVNEPTDLDALGHTILSHIAAGATIIDVGGQSSRPNAPDITAEEEIARILPAIEIIKALPEAAHIAISVDTYRASVAEVAIKAGAHIINDISAGSLDLDMLPTIARLGCTYVMMHMRGTPATMQDPENTSYPEGLIPTVASELLQRTYAASAAGIRRWRIILDPGIGFAKTVEQSAELLGKFAELRNYEKLKTYPWLVGSSRKGFIGKLTGVEDAEDRIDGTAATVTAAVAGGAEIVRVHDVKEMVRVVKMADAMYRSPSPTLASSSR